MRTAIIYLILDADCEVACAADTKEEAMNIIKHTEGLEEGTIEETTLYAKD